jgi:hypothetical protein
MACFFIGQASINALMPVIGQIAGLSALGASRVMALGMLFGFAGALAARFVGERVSEGLAITSMVLLLAGVGLAITAAPSPLLFAATMMGIAFSTMFSVPYFFARLGAFDHGGRYASFGPAMILTGAGIGPGIAVVLKDDTGLLTVGAFSALLLALGGIGFRLSTRGAEIAGRLSRAGCS